MMGKDASISHHSIIQAMTDSLSWKNTEGYYLGCNLAFLKLMQVEERFIIGKTDEDLAWRAYVNILQAKDEEVLSSKKASLGKKT